MRFLKQFLICWLMCAAWVSKAEQPDSLVSPSSLLVLPFASYQQETSVAPGMAYGYYFKSKDLSRISSITGSAVYTFLNQFTFNITPKIFFDSNKWYLYSNLSVRNYPDYYFGVGNKPAGIKQAYTSRNFSLLLQPQYAVSKNLLFGVSLSVRSEWLMSDTFGQYGGEGWKPFSQLNIGLLTAFDSRDNQFYPQKGIFAKMFFTTSKEVWGISYPIQEFSVDYRQYLPLFGSHVLAWQAVFDGVYSDRAIPFQLLPTLGGRDMLRGFRQGMYRDNVLALAQAEYRIPVCKRLKAAVFCSAGDVVNSADCEVYKLKVAYGAGLRYRLNDARVHLRFDFARNNYGDKLQFYITATEAF
ncbi:MAG TPA: BamA/TamA family outer membrane protein [Paludibacter sp.]|nr:BamA/TamA family outer membrane protein [Paludibacter sp.]